MQSEPPLLPIREVTRLTGVNPVTLRAWERRYGLIVPHRTPKGHRLYDQTHVQRIHMILHWLNRGVTVGQVKPLLENQEQANREPPQDDWQRLRLQLIEAVASLAERRLDQQLNQAMALYPVSTLCEHLFMPLLADLQARWHGYPNARMEQVFFHSWLRTKLSVRVYHNNRQLGGEPVLLVNASQLPFDPLLWLGAWLLSDAGCAVEVFDWPLPARELPIAVEQLQACGLLLSLDGAIDVRELHRALAPVTVPTVLFGNAVSLYRHALQRPPEAPLLHLLDTPLAAAQVFLSLHADP